MTKMHLGFIPCKQCGYTAPPELQKTERKHFDAHAYECTRCLWKPETTSSKELALAAWNTPASESAAGDLPYSTELSDKRVERFMEEFGYPDSTTLFSMLKQYENQIRHEIAEAMRDNGHLNTKEQK